MARDEFSYPGQEYEPDFPRKDELAERREFERRMTRQAKPVYITMSGTVEDMKPDWHEFYKSLSNQYAHVDFEIQSSVATGERTISVKFICHPWAANE